MRVSARALPRLVLKDVQKSIKDAVFWSFPAMEIVKYASGNIG